MLLSGNLTQFHYDASSTGQDLTEAVLTPANVNSTDFGRQFITQLDGQVYAQPLAVESINITRVGSNSTETTGVHNVLYVATMHDSLFAVDADTGAILWQDSFLQINSPEVTTNLSPSPTAGVIPFPTGTLSTTENAAINANDVAPEEGVFGTPVINEQTNILYCISYTQERRIAGTATPSATGADWHFVLRLYAINLADGSVAIAPTTPVGAPVPAAAGQTIADTALNYTGSSFPNFVAFTGYEYFSGPYIKASGDNGQITDSQRSDVDGWVTNPQDSTSVFAGTTPYAQGDIALNAILQPSRTGLMLLNGTIYFGTTSHGDEGPYYGWVLGYNATTLQNTAAFVTTPTWENYNIISGSAGTSRTTYDNQGAIWGGEQSITTDGTYLYMSIGNGAFDWTSANFPASGTNTTTDNGHTVQLPLDGDYGNAIIKLAVDPSANQGGLNLASLPTTFNPDGTTPGTNGQNLNGYGLKIADFFEPSNMVYLNYKDQDVGSGGVLLLPNTVTSTVPGHVGDPMLVTGGKEGRVYLIDRNNMGGFDTGYFATNADDTATYAGGTKVFSTPGNGVPNQGPDAISYDRVLGEYEGAGSIFTVPSFYMNGTIPTLVVDGNSSAERTFNLKTFQYTTSSLPPNDTGSNNPTPLATTSSTFVNHGSTAAISANGTANAIAWNIDSQESTANDDLLAFNINGMSNLYTSGSGVLTNNITHDTATKFSVPSIFNGMVYVGIGAGWGSSSSTTQTAWAQGAIVGFGLQSSYLATSGLFGAPTALSGTYTATYNGSFNSSGVALSWTRNSTDETETEIDRSSNNGSSWSVVAYVPNGTSSFTDATAVLGKIYEYRVRAISGANTTSFSTSAPIEGSLNVTSGTYAIPAPAVGAGFQPFSLATLSIGAGAGVALGTASAHADRTILVLNSLSIAATGNVATGTLDLGGNDLIIHNTVGTVGTTLSTINGELQSGYDAGEWNGTGIISSTAATLSSHLTTIGVIQNGSATSFDNQPVTSTDILLKYTYYGDATLDGVVSTPDYTKIDGGFLSRSAGWSNGDFNYDGVINGSDYTLIDNAFNTQGASLAAVAAHAEIAAKRMIQTAISYAPSTLIIPDWFSAQDILTDYKRRHAGSARR